MAGKSMIPLYAGGAFVIICAACLIYLFAGIPAAVLFSLVAVGIFLFAKNRKEIVKITGTAKTKEGEKKFSPAEEGKKLIFPLIIFFIIFYIYEYITKGYLSDAVFEAVFATLGWGVFSILTRPITKWLGIKYNKNGRLYWVLFIMFGIGAGMVIIRGIIIASWRIFGMIFGS